MPPGVSTDFALALDSMCDNKVPYCPYNCDKPHRPLWTMSVAGALFALPTHRGLNRRSSLLCAPTQLGGGQGGCVFFSAPSISSVSHETLR
jgi:hypothetical protein